MAEFFSKGGRQGWLKENWRICVLTRQMSSPSRETVPAY